MAYQNSILIIWYKLYIIRQKLLTFLSLFIYFLDLVFYFGDLFDLWKKERNMEGVPDLSNPCSIKITINFLHTLSPRALRRYFLDLFDVFLQWYVRTLKYTHKSYFCKCVCTSIVRSHFITITCFYFVYLQAYQHRSTLFLNVDFYISLWKEVDCYSLTTEKYSHDTLQ